jgi:hypothetical protein
MVFAGNVAPSVTINPCLRRTLAQKSQGSNPAASHLHLCVARLDYFLCGTYRCQLGNHRAGREGTSQGVGGVAGCLHDMQYPVIWYWVAWLRRRKLAELNEVEKIMNEMDGTGPACPEAARLITKEEKLSCRQHWPYLFLPRQNPCRTSLLPVLLVHACFYLT